MKRVGITSSVSGKKVCNDEMSQSLLLGLTTPPLELIPSTSEYNIRSEEPVMIFASSARGEGFTMDSIPPHHYFLGGSKFIVVSSYTGSIHIHLRRYYQTGTEFFPSKHGITFSPASFHELMESIFGIEHSRQPRVFNRELFVSCSESKHDFAIHFQRLCEDSDGPFHFISRGVKLNPSQFSELQDACTNIWRSVLQQIVGPAFKNAFNKYKAVSCASNAMSIEGELTALLKNVLQTAVAWEMGKLLNCSACRLPLSEMPGNQLAHRCATTTARELVMLHFADAVARLEPKDLAKKFAKESSTLDVTKDFMDSLDIELLLKDVKKMCEEEY